MAGLTGTHLLILLAVVVLLFGATRLPGLAKGLGQSMRIFKSEVKAMKSDDDKVEKPETSTAAEPRSTDISEPSSHTKS